MEASNTNYTIMIVEDSPLNLRMLSLRLKKHEFNIVEQKDGTFLTEALAQFKPDLILMDMNLPGINGWTLTGSVKTNPRTSSIPIIAVTANAMRGDRERALLAGCDEYVSKPIDFRSLLTKIDCLLKASSSTSPAITHIGSEYPHVNKANLASKRN